MDYSTMSPKINFYFQCLSKVQKFLHIDSSWAFNHFIFPIGQSVYLHKDQQSSKSIRNHTYSIYRLHPQFQLCVNSPCAQLSLLHPCVGACHCGNCRFSGGFCCLLDNSVPRSSAQKQGREKRAWNERNSFLMLSKIVSRIKSVSWNLDKTSWWNLGLKPSLKYLILLLKCSLKVLAGVWNICNYFVLHRNFELFIIK